MAEASPDLLPAEAYALRVALDPAQSAWLVGEVPVGAVLMSDHDQRPGRARLDRRAACVSADSCKPLEAQSWQPMYDGHPYCKLDEPGASTKARQFDRIGVGTETRGLYASPGPSFDAPG